MGYNAWAVDGVKSKRLIMATGAALLALAMLASLSGCGGVSSGLTVGGAASIAPGGSIAPTETLRLAFLQELDVSSLPGNISVTAAGLPVPFHFALTDAGFTIVIAPVNEWPAGESITVTLAGGEGGIRWVDGRFARTMNLGYTVRPAL